MTCCLHTLIISRHVYDFLLAQHAFDIKPIEFTAFLRSQLQTSFQKNMAGKKWKKMTKCVRYYHKRKSKEDDIFFSARSWKFHNWEYGSDKDAILCNLLDFVVIFSYFVFTLCSWTGSTWLRWGSGTSGWERGTGSGERIGEYLKSERYDNLCSQWSLP